MDQNSDNKNNSFSAAFPLPPDQSQAGQPAASETGPNPAVELIRKRIEAAYAQEPALAEEANELKATPPSGLSKHQQFIMDLTGSGKSLADVQIAWHEYYAGLSDLEKYQVWQEFYEAHAAADRAQPAAPSMLPDQLYTKTPTSSVRAKTAPVKPWENLAGQMVDKFKQRPSLAASKAHLKSLLFGLSMGCLVVLVVLFSFFNERFIAPLIQPSRNISNIPLISGSGPVGPDPEIIIPKINVQIPVVYGVDTISESAVDSALEQGVVHYADTAMPGEDGNLVIVGHSSNNIFNKGRYKFAFVLLSHLDNGDTFYLQKDGKRYTYQVYKKEIVSPTDVSVLGQTDKLATASLITCDPPGTSINRLVVIGEQIDPNPVANAPATTHNTLATSTKIVPGNAPSLWSRIIHAL